MCEDSPLEMTLEDREMRLKPQHTQPTAGGSPWMNELYDLFAPAREEARQYSEEEIDETIDAAVQAVREVND